MTTPIPTYPEAPCPYRRGDVLVCYQPTNFHRLGEVVVVEGTDKRYAGDVEPYWVRLYGKPGHYSWPAFRKATIDEIAAALSAGGEAVAVTYRNWRGEVSERTITPKRIWFGATEWHPEPQWLLTAFDHEKQGDRDFALKDFGAALSASQAPAPDRLPCPVRLPSGLTFGKGVDLQLFLDACERHKDTSFDEPKAPPPALKEMPDLREEFERDRREAYSQAAMLVRFLEEANFDAVLRHALTLLPTDHQLDMAQTLLANLGMVAINQRWVSGDDGEEASPRISALRTYAMKEGFVLLPLEEAAERDRAALTAPQAPAPDHPLGTRYAIEHDGFTGTVIGHYERLDGKRGVVLQQDGTNVVHVYGEKWLRPSESASGAQK